MTLSKEEIAIISLTQNQVATVDARDFGWLSKWKWCAALYNPGFYAVRTTSRRDGKRHQILMHRLITGAGPEKEIDHIDGNTLNNRRSNLRIVQGNGNHWNQPLRKDSTTGFKGVTFVRRDQKFKAQIGINGRKKHLGYFATAETAADAYDTAAIELFGPFARTNAMLMTARSAV